MVILIKIVKESYYLHTKDVVLREESNNLLILQRRKIQRLRLTSGKSCRESKNWSSFKKAN